MSRKYFVESLDNGVVITKYGRLSDYMNPSGHTLSFNCDRLDDALNLARIILGGADEVRRGYVDTIVNVHAVEHLNKDNFYDEEDCDFEE